jgi:hypothetical protein
MLIARGIPRARALRYVNMLVSGDAVEPGCVCERTRAITSATARPSLSTSFNGLAGQKHRYITAEYVRVAPGMRPVLRQTASSAPMSRLVGGVIQQRRAAAAGRRRNSSRCVSATSNTHTPRTLGTYLFMWGRERVSDTQGAAAAGATRRCTGHPAGFDRPLVGVDAGTWSNHHRTRPAEQHRRTSDVRLRTSDSEAPTTSGGVKETYEAFSVDDVVEAAAELDRCSMMSSRWTTRRAALQSRAPRTRAVCPGEPWRRRRAWRPRPRLGKYCPPLGPWKPLDRTPVARIRQSGDWTCSFSRLGFGSHRARPSRAGRESREDWRAQRRRSNHPCLHGDDWLTWRTCSPARAGPAPIYFDQYNRKMLLLVSQHENRLAFQIRVRSVLCARVPARSSTHRRRTTLG